MKQFFLLSGQSLTRVAALVLVVLAALSLRPQAAWASHIRAGDIQAKIDTTAAPGTPQFNARRVFFKMVLYTDNTSGVDEDAVAIFFGDGTSSCKRGVPRFGGRRPIPGNTDTSVNIYYFEHTFPSAGTFTVAYIGENRNASVLNMDLSSSQSFYISTTIKLDPSLVVNHSPVFTAPAVDKGAVGQVFLHNPAAYDADGDSLVFSLRSCQQVPLGVDGTVGSPCLGAPATGDNTPKPQACTNYRYPNDPSVTPSIPPIQVIYNGAPAGVPGAPAIFVQNPRTGQITWNAPVVNGTYNVAMEVREYRKGLRAASLIGVVIRDMQIIVVATSNMRPTITIPTDLCVVAGERVTGTVTAIDAPGTNAPATPVSLFAYSGIIPPATFRQTQSGPPPAPAIGVFNWQTDCSNVARQPYLVVFKAQDNPNPPSPSNPVLTDQKTWSITVVGPAPQNLRAAALLGVGCNPNSVELTWNTYVCANASRIHIYRKLNTSTFVPGPCDTGIPASAGYTLIKSLPVSETRFTDNNVSATGTVQGLERGQTYCYRIYAEFPLPAGGASIASQEACVTLLGRAAMLTNVDVETTSGINGQIAVRWTQPRAAIGNSFGANPAYVLSRGEGLAPTTFTPVRAPITALTDTSFVDTGLNTQDLQYTYKLEFVRTFAAGSGCDPVREVAPTASSVRTSAVPANLGTAVALSWTYNVPWDNTAQPAVIYRRFGNTGPFVRIATAATSATSGTYLDRDAALRKNETYCYYVQTTGRYANFPFLDALVNKSQERCTVLTSPPCTPVLAPLNTNCDSLANLQEFPGLNQRYVNRLRWTAGDKPTGCDATVLSYRVFYRPTPTGRFTLIGSTTQTSFLHGELEFSGGCYAVQAVGRSGVLSDTSNVACQNNCVFFKMPNIFTPSGDGVNDVLRPKNNSPIRSIHFKAFNRWGVKVFENTTTAADHVFINWDGGGPVGESGSGAKVVDGIYYYLAEVEFADFDNTRRSYKGWVEIVR